MPGAKIFLALVAASGCAAPASAFQASPPTWQTAVRMPERVARPTNVIHLEGGRLLWNGSEASEANARAYLDLITQLKPRPLTVLSYGADAPRERIARTRSMIEDVLGCKAGECLEVTGS